MSLWSELKTTAQDLLQRKATDSSTSQDSLGDRGEREAERFLKKRGLRIVARSYRNHIGEIDLVAVDQKSKPRTIVFIEVKTRKSDFKGQPVEAVDEKKQRQVSNTAMVYLKQHDLLECRFRFDIVGIIWPEETARPEILHYVNAFAVVGTGQMFN